MGQHHNIMQSSLRTFLATLSLLTLTAAEPWSVEFTVNLAAGQKGTFVVEVNPEWAPHGAGRFRELIQSNFFKGNRFFRVIESFVAQFGISGAPTQAAAWSQNTIPDDPVEKSVENRRGAISFSTKISKDGPKYGPLSGSEKLDSGKMHFLAAAKMEGVNSRSTQLFINLKDNLKLHEAGNVPFGRVVSGMDVVDKLYSGYGETAAGRGTGTGPDQLLIQSEGNKYLKTEFSGLSYIVSTRELRRDEL